jgi:ferrochelatase
MRSGDGVLVSAHGTVERLEDVPAFLQRIRRGRPTPEHIVHEVQTRLRHIGGSPLLRITREQAAGLEARLGVPVVVGMRLWDPSIESAVAEATSRGVTRLLSLPLAPQSVAVYHEPTRSAAAAAGVELLEAPPWGLEPALLAAFNEAIDEGFARLPEERRAAAALVLSAHSLPTRIIAAGDAYEREFRAMADAVHAARTESRPTRIAFQSQGMDGGDWLGPDLETTFRELEKTGVRDVLVAAIGFLSDHVETLYDLDVDAKVLGEKAGVRVERAPSLDARPKLLDALEAVARRCFA